MKNAELEHLDDKHRRQSLRKLDQQIKRLECIIKELLDEIDLVWTIQPLMLSA
jgi:hypothetical protein